MSIQSITHVPIAESNEDQTTTVPTHTLEEESAIREQYVQSIKDSIAKGTVLKGRKRVEANTL